MPFYPFKLVKIAAIGLSKIRKREIGPWTMDHGPLTVV
jgi:hypothetical protein